MCDGHIHGGDPGAPVHGISTDTRSLQAGELFVALKGEQHNGHDHLAAAFERGAVGALVSKSVEAALPQIVVDDTLIAYGSLGAAARQESTACFIAVSGSAGKTTTKDMLGAITSLAGPALVTPGTENNEVGVPRLLLQLGPEHRYCVLELAMRGPGEIKYLASLCKPRIGIITNIGEAHVGRLGSREAIAQVKAELLTSLPDDGFGVLNASDFFFGLHKEMTPCPVISYGLCGAPDEVVMHVTAEGVRARGVAPASFALRIGGDRATVRLRVPGVHNVSNALAAAAAAWAAGIGVDAIKAGLEGYEGSPMRSEVIRAPGGYTIINDAYNASPTSTPEGLRILGQCSGRRVFVFGDMLELGQAAEQAHRTIGRLAASTGVDWLIAVGTYVQFAAEEAEGAGLQTNVVQSAEQAVDLLRPVLDEGDTVLVKASRDMGLESVVKGLLGNA